MPTYPLTLRVSTKVVTSLFSHRQLVLVIEPRFYGAFSRSSLLAPRRYL
jgi:hypothetical protein